MRLKELEKRLEKEPDNLGLKVTVAGLLHDAGRTVEAVELYRAVARAYREAARTAQAIAVCKAILAIAPEDEPSRALLADLTAPPLLPAETAPVPKLPTPVPKTSTPVPRPPVVPAPATEPKRRSSLDETPLPKPVPHHIADPTTGQNRLSPRELVDADPTRPDGLARTGEDVSAELETRPVRKLDSEELRKLDCVDFDDGVTPVRDSDEITRPRDKLPEKD